MPMQNSMVPLTRRLNQTLTSRIISSRSITSPLDRDMALLTAIYNIVPREIIKNAPSDMLNHYFCNPCVPIFEKSINNCVSVVQQEALREPGIWTTILQHRSNELGIVLSCTLKKDFYQNSEVALINDLDNGRMGPSSGRTTLGRTSENQLFDLQKENISRLVQDFKKVFLEGKTITKLPHPGSEATFSSDYSVVNVESPTKQNIESKHHVLKREGSTTVARPGVVLLDGTQSGPVPKEGFALSARRAVSPPAQADGTQNCAMNTGNTRTILVQPGPGPLAEVVSRKKLQGSYLSLATLAFLFLMVSVTIRILFKKFQKNK